ncbi:hypothetical protein H072_6726 [Dactylellina haptotyla CBS 200.50]|uniref:F-box domain-containing protein n=1 Tax=Dactylellina haptotyla (strain CBS 200.50) TaxID=1284197 RepID=S8BVY8_DACHA|nr:hypothetical protein H072_6726 [Dactylellina haptotyla CBS 200.50]
MSASQVFCIPELLELILTNVPWIECLTTCRRVCKQWNAIIENSSVLTYYLKTGIPRLPSQRSTIDPSNPRTYKDTFKFDFTPAALFVLRSFWQGYIRHVGQRRILYLTYYITGDRTVEKTKLEREADGMTILLEFVEMFDRIAAGTHGIIPITIPKQCFYSGANITMASSGRDPTAKVGPEHHEKLVHISNLITASAARYESPMVYLLASLAADILEDTTLKYGFSIYGGPEWRFMLGIRWITSSIYLVFGVQWELTEYLLALKDGMVRRELDKLGVKSGDYRAKFLAVRRPSKNMSTPICEIEFKNITFEGDEKQPFSRHSHR